MLETRNHGENQIDCIPCDICKIKDSIYRCPACFTRTCSLLCCKEHKKQQNCNGRRDKTAFVPLNKFSNSTLASDFHFLEDVLARSDRGKRLIKELGFGKQQAHGTKRRRGGDSADNIESSLHPLSQLALKGDEEISGAGLNFSHDMINNHDHANEAKKIKGVEALVQLPSKVNKGLPNNGTLSQYPKHKQRLVQKAAVKERNINLLLMPPGMSRHMMNKSTKYNPKIDMMQWKIEIIFHNVDSAEDGDGNVHIKKTHAMLLLEGVPEKENVFQILSKEFEKQISHCPQSTKRSTLINFRHSTKYELKSDIMAIMKKLPSNSSKPLYNKLNLRQNLKEMLNGKSVIEFPCVEIVRKEDIKHFPLTIEEL